MKILIIYSHPSRKSYTFQVLEQLKSELAAQNWSVEVSDLYSQNFQSDMSESEYENGATPDDILGERRKIESADCIIFLYPVWWSDCPAKLKGWFDRIFSPGFAYAYNGKTRMMKTIKYGLAICTAGHPNELLVEAGISESMEIVMLDDRLGDRFENKEMIILGGTLQIEQVREMHKVKIKEVTERIVKHCA